jgi:hypothetical protein
MIKDYKRRSPVKETTHPFLPCPSPLDLPAKPSRGRQIDKNRFCVTGEWLGQGVKRAQRRKESRSFFIMSMNLY